MRRKGIKPRYFSIPDLVILLLLATAIYGVSSFANAWRSEFTPATEIDLSVWALPYYTLLSAIRGVVAYFISLAFTLVIGHLAAKSRSAEKLIIPLLDIFQCIPVLGFLPGLLLALVALFPHSNIGLELTAVLMIFTGQVWNMTFSYYSSLKSIPNEFQEASTVMGLSRRQKLLKLELPFSAVNLAWNSLLSMAGGWFFLIPCEAFTLGDHEFRLPGIGAYMHVAVKQGDRQAMGMAVVAMILLIVLMDFVIWRPILAWVRRFRLEEVSGQAPAEPLMQIWIRESRLLRWVRVSYHHWSSRGRIHRTSLHHKSKKASHVLNSQVLKIWSAKRHIGVVLRTPKIYRFLEVVATLASFGLILFGSIKLLLVLIEIPPATWFTLLRNTFFTFGRVIFSLALSTLWAVPVGIWIGISARRTKVAQPFIQILASFPAPMLYPLVLEFLFVIGIPFDWASMVLMFLGVQWYVLFNVLAGALRIPKHLSEALSLMDTSHWDRWKALYLPSIFPALVTGWITAAGGAWNASIIAEYMVYKGTILKTPGLGSVLSVATASENLPVFAASLTLMVAVVILLNRFVWSRLYDLAQNRYRMDF